MRLAQLSNDGEKIHKIYEPEECEIYGWTPGSPPQFTPDIILVDIEDMPEVREGWLHQNGVFVDPESLITLEEWKNRKREEIAAARYGVETGGMDFYGVSIATDDRSKSLLYAAYGEAAQNPNFVDRWKGSDGVFRPVDAITIIALYGALRAHVSACFAKEAALLDILAECENREKISQISWDMEIDELTNWNEVI